MTFSKMDKAEGNIYLLSSPIWYAVGNLKVLFISC